MIENKLLTGSELIDQSRKKTIIAGATVGTWRATTIVGDSRQRNGMLQNHIYIGQLVHERTAKILHSETRKEPIKPQPESDWVTQEVPELRIINDATWNMARDWRESYAGLRPKFMR